MHNSNNNKRKKRSAREEIKKCLLFACQHSCEHWKYIQLVWMLMLLLPHIQYFGILHACHISSNATTSEDTNHHRRHELQHHRAPELREQTTKRRGIVTATVTTYESSCMWQQQLLSQRNVQKYFRLSPDILRICEQVFVSRLVAKVLGKSLKLIWTEESKVNGLTLS